MAFATIDNPELYFQSVLWTGNQSTQAITFDGSEDMQPDFVWIKQRADDGYSHELFDVVRGVTKYVCADTNAAEATGSTTLTAFGSDGFTLGADTVVNKNTKTYVSWNWKAGTSFSNDASSTSVGTIDSSGSINTAAGISILTYTGTGSAGTIAHGLGAVPKWIFTKDTDNSNAPYVYLEGAGNTHGLRLSTTDVKEDDNTLWNDTTPTSSVFSVGSNTGSNRSSNPIIAYIWSEIKGFSKFGSYIGNGNANGTFAFLGFKPAFVMVRDPGNAENWLMYDNKRPGYNLNNNHLMANTIDTEVASSANTMDLLSTGFKVRSSNNGLNRSGATFFYMAFAESPFVNSNGIPNNAR